MTFNFEKAEKLLEKQDYTRTDNSVFKGITILAKYTEELTFTAEHDQIWVYLKNDDDYSKITKEDLVLLGQMNWMVDSENEGFSKFV